MTAIKDYIKENDEKLDLFTTAITRAHGKNHPEAFDVREIYTDIQNKTEESEHPNLDTEFSKLRKVTNDYTIPDDVCETYAAVYTMLSEADKTYQL
ncbi:hypothetical protein GCM10008932_19550 [Alkalibacterium iburiense]|uniref:Iron-sulfur cluster repair di-iron protein, ric n=1 Tax=Alkalibacterium iburiense TaxID=290589 RepID=A0ABN0XMK9_9LACT